MTNYMTRRKEIKKKPLPVLHYNKFMPGINCQDQMLAYYLINRKILRWYKKLAIHFFQIMLLNSYLLYNKFSENKITLYKYRLEIIRQL